MDLADAAHFFGPAVCIQKQFLVLQVVFTDIRIRKIFVITLQIFFPHFFRVKDMDRSSRCLDLFPYFCVQVCAKLVSPGFFGEERKSAKVPMRSAILGVFALFLQALGYFAISAYVYAHSAVYGSVLFFVILLFIVIGAGHHVKCGFAEYVFLRLGRDKKAHTMMLDLFNSAPITKICYLGYIVFIITLIIAILTGTAALPLWAAIFTILPIFIILFPFKIIGTLHISAMISMLAWMILI